MPDHRVGFSYSLMSNTELRGAVNELETKHSRDSDDLNMMKKQLEHIE